MQRRTFLLSVSALAATAAWGAAHRKPTPMNMPAIESLHTNWRSFAPDYTELPTPGTPLTEGEPEWRERLSDDAYRVLFNERTERAGSSSLDSEYREGLFVCAACDLPLFTSAMKFDSGTGWPSFFTAIPDHLATSRDFKLVLPRTEYHCVRCGGHQGHVFNDGPAPTNERWCNNGVALRFIANESVTTG